MQPKSAESWTVGRLLDWTTGHLRGKGIESPRLESELLLAHALGCRRIDLYARYLEDATDAQRIALLDRMRTPDVRPSSRIGKHNTPA